ncbi:hypothetical protein GCM10009839_36820 [Catenulispora yoronensis]|uniref:Uncharacterized protein n=1 Tax=Catenulispora yoronensis TaxID=450799 RepID=A0ABP5FS96_9ACTN
MGGGEGGFEVGEGAAEGGEVVEADVEVVVGGHGGVLLRSGEEGGGGRMLVGRGGLLRHMGVMGDMRDTGRRGWLAIALRVVAEGRIAKELKGC